MPCSILNTMRPASLKVLSRAFLTSPYTFQSDQFPVREVHINPESSAIQVKTRRGLLLSPTDVYLVLPPDITTVVCTTYQI